MLRPVILPVTDAARPCRAIGMIHVHCTTALLNHNCTRAMSVEIPTKEDNERMHLFIKQRAEPLLDALSKNVPLIGHATAQNPCRSVVFLARQIAQAGGAVPAIPLSLIEEFNTGLFGEIATMKWMKYLVDRAVAEALLLFGKGIDIVEVENIAAPYFVGPNAVPWPELFAVFLCCAAVDEARLTFAAERNLSVPPALGCHILSCDELETLPIAIATGAFFVRAEATLFAGMRPEGAVQNSSNLARFFYMRRLLRQAVGSADDNLQLPLVFSDIHKKHTHFVGDLDHMEPWLENISFVHLEGVIVTGQHTGSDIKLEDLKRARAAIDKYKTFLRDKIVPASKTVSDISGLVAPGVPLLPLLTGSGTTLEDYVLSGADYIIVGSLLKEGGYWENAVCPQMVEKVVARISNGNAKRVGSANKA